MHAFVQSLATAITTAITIIVSVGIVINKNTAVEEVRVPSGTLQRPWWLKAGGFPGQCVSQDGLPEAKTSNLQVTLLPKKAD